jgi:hypothetical protein
METPTYHKFFEELLSTALQNSTTESEVITNIVEMYSVYQIQKHDALQTKTQELTTLAQKQAVDLKEAQEAARKLGEGLKKYKAAHTNLKKALEGVEE